MKLLIDMNLSPSWVEALRVMGFEAVHWSDIGDPRASDRELLAHAKAAGYTIFTNDLDFGAILAASAASSPSVIQVRATDLTLEDGYIGLQAESQPVEFRKIRLLTLSGCMNPDSPAYRTYFARRDDARCTSR